MITWHDVLYYVRLFVRWWYVLAFAVLLALGTAWIMIRDQPAIFFSQATLSVGNNFEVSAPSETQVSLSNVLADYYAALVKREVILGPVVEHLQLKFPWYIIRDRMLLTRVDRGANLLEIKITDTNPERAAAIANTIADQLITYTPNAPEKVAAQQAEINRQLQETQANIEAVEAKIAELENRLSNLSSAIDISDVQNQLEALQRTRQRYLDEYANLINLSNQTSANSLSVFEQARAALEPLPKKRLLTLAMASLGGLVMAIVTVLVLDRLDERWRTSNELLSRTGIRSLGDVPEGYPLVGGTLPDDHARRTAINSAFSNMVLAAQSKLPQTLLISSPHSSTARSVLALDIAEMYTRTGRRVILIDTESVPLYMGEFVRSQQHKPSAGIWKSDPADDHGSIWPYMRATVNPNLLVLSGLKAGHDRFSSLVPLVVWPDLLRFLRKSADVIIFDGPSALESAEASLLAPVVDGVLLVLNGKKDARSTTIRSRERLTSETNSKFLGAIVTTPTARSMRGTATAKPKRSGFRVALSSSGITITLGTARNNRAPGDEDIDRVRKQLPSPEGWSDRNSAAPNEVITTTTTEASKEEERLTWEDLLTFEARGKQRVEGLSFVATPSAAIITPPPGESMSYQGPEGAKDRQGLKERHRRPRIAQGRRAASGRSNRSDAGTGADGHEAWVVGER